MEPPSGFELGTPGLEIQLTKPMFVKGHEGVDITPKKEDYQNRINRIK